MYADAGFGFGFAAAYSPALASSQHQPPFDFDFAAAAAGPASMDATASSLPLPEMPAAHLVSRPLPVLFEISLHSLASRCCFLVLCSSCTLISPNQTA
jgi:hypothetical protein